MIITRYMDMPTSVKGVTAKDSNDDYNIYINPALSYDEQIKAYKHEMKHIRLNHFYDGKSVADKENEI